jgi:hypothetical protein
MSATKLIAAWLEPAVRCWFRDQCRELLRRHYLWYKPGTETEHGAVVIAPDKPNEDWELATGEPVSPARTERQVFDWAFAICWKLPLLRRGE